MIKHFTFLLVGLAALAAPSAFAQGQNSIFTGYEAPLGSSVTGPNSSPSAIAMGDINGDGNLDYVVSHRASGTVSVQLGNGTGGFTTGITVIVGPEPVSVVLGDIDWDGKLDLATANYGNNTASYCYGDGTGRFGQVSNVSTPARPVKVILADMDQTGYPELIVAGETTVQVRTNYRGQLFEFGYLSVNMYGPNTSVAAGLVDTDHRTDLVTSTYSNSFSVATASSSGSFNSAFTPFASGGLTSVAIGDINEDGFPDLIGTSYNEQYVTVRFNYGSQNYFLVQKDYPVGGNPRDVVVRDVNGDGHLDLLTANDAQSSVSVRLGDGRGSFTPAGDYPVGTRPIGLVVGDVNNDGRFDFVTANKTNISVRLNTVPPTKLALESTNAFSYTAGVSALHFKKGNATDYVAFLREVRPGRAPLMMPVDGVTYANSTQEVHPNNLLANGTYFIGSGNLAAGDTLVYVRNPLIGHVYEMGIYEYITDPARGPVYRSVYPARLTFTAARIAPSLRGSLNAAREPSLTWSLIAQYQSTAVRLQSSLDGITYSDLGPVTPGVDSLMSSMSVNFQPRVALTAKTYYRVQLTHSDGVTLYSPVLTLAPPAPLPVELTRFAATVRADGNTLVSWATASEKNSDFFQVERSENGRDFTSIGRVRAAGNTSIAHTYELTDARPRPSVTYYRLYQVDLDHTGSYSPVVAVAAAAPSATLSLFPNPAQNGQRVTLSLPVLPHGTPIQVRVRALASTQLLLDRQLPSTDELSWTLTDYPAGVYLVEVESAGARWHTRLLVR
jgi:hypothetical protein